MFSQFLQEKAETPEERRKRVAREDRRSAARERIAAKKAAEPKPPLNDPAVVDASKAREAAAASSTGGLELAKARMMGKVDVPQEPGPPKITADTNLKSKKPRKKAAKKKETPVDDGTGGQLDTLLASIQGGEEQDYSGVSGVPEFKHKQLAPLNDLIKQHKGREDSKWYHEQARLKAKEGSPGQHLETDFGVETDFANAESPQAAAASLMQFAKKNKNPALGRSLKPYWKEVENFHKNFADPELRDENNYQQIIQNSRINEIDDSVVDQEFGKMNKTDRRYLGSMGFGGGGGRANQIEDVDARAKQLLKIYLQQGGRDAYLGGEDTSPLSWRDMTVDHVHSEGDTEFWKNAAQERGMDPNDYVKLANDPNENYVMTRSGFNGAQKRDNSLDTLYNNMEKEYYSQGQEAVEENESGTRQKSLRKQLREDAYYKPMADVMRKAIKNGMDPEAYNELWENYQTGRKEIEKSPRTDRSQMKMDRNEFTDPWRTLGEKSNLGMKIFANDGLRAKEAGQIAGWSGVGGTTSGSNAADGEHPSYPFEDTAMDHYFDPMRRLKLGGNEGEADAIHKFTQFMGNGFVTGKLDSQEWQQYLDGAAKMANSRVPEEWQGEHDQDRSDEYFTTINRTLNKLNKEKGGLDEPKTAPQRSLSKLFGQGHQKNFANAAMQTLEGLLNPESDLNVRDYLDR